jgi:hypothetical protein
MIMVWNKHGKIEMVALVYIETELENSHKETLPLYSLHSSEICT